MDIETLGTAPGSVVVSIGLVRFNPQLDRVQAAEELTPGSLKVVLNLQESLDEDFKISASTFKWWLGQSKEAQKATFDHPEVYDLVEGLVAVAEYFKKGDKVWGNGASFDIPLVEAYFNKFRSVLPWGYSRVRCYRTLREMNDYDASLVPNNLLAHDCVADAIYQAQVTQAIAIANPKLRWR